LEALSEGDWAAGEVAFAPSPWPPPRPDLSRLAEQHLNSLLEALGAESDWLFEAAFNVLVRARDPVTAQRAVARLLECKPARHPHAAIIATVSDPVPPEAAARLLAGNVPLLRMGAAEAARVLAETKDQELWEPRSR
jgi:hypothetical protein